jgi:hypothetical protein
MAWLMLTKLKGHRFSNWLDRPTQGEINRIRSLFDWIAKNE